MQEEISANNFQKQEVKPKKDRLYKFALVGFIIFFLVVTLEALYLAFTPTGKTFFQKIFEGNSLNLKLSAPERKIDLYGVDPLVLHNKIMSQRSFVGGTMFSYSLKGSVVKAYTKNQGSQTIYRIKIRNEKSKEEIDLGFSEEQIKLTTIELVSADEMIPIGFNQIEEGDEIFIDIREIIIGDPPTFRSQIHLIRR